MRGAHWPTPVQSEDGWSSWLGPDLDEQPHSDGAPPASRVVRTGLTPTHGMASCAGDRAGSLAKNGYRGRERGCDAAAVATDRAMSVSVIWS